jgi:septum formation protein
MSNIQFILASGSKGRMRLVQQIGFVPHLVISPDIDETQKKNEKPKDLAMRLALQKSYRALEMLENKANIVILSGDTVVAKGNKIADKATTDDEVRANMALLSGSNHSVFSAFCVIKTDADGNIIKTIHKYEQTKIKFKNLTQQDINSLVVSKTGISCAGGYSVDGVGESFVIKMQGSFSNVIGLPTYLVRNALFTCGLNCVLI